MTKPAWEIIAADTALEAHKQTAHYAQFSDTIYKGIQKSLSSELQAVLGEEKKHLKAKDFGSIKKNAEHFRIMCENIGYNAHRQECLKRAKERRIIN